MLDRVLFDDDTFRVTTGLLGGMKVTVKPRNLTRSAPTACVQHFQQTTEAQKQRGIHIGPGSAAFEALAEEFAEAIFAQPNGPRWTILFGTHPDQVADRLKSYG